jgi:Sigma-70 region 2
MADVDGFDAFYRGTSRRLLHYAYGLTGNPTEAQDLVQEAYARAWQRWRRLVGYDDQEAWLRLVVTRLATDRWRRLGVRRAAAAASRPPAPVDPPSATRKELWRRPVPRAERVISFGDRIMVSGGFGAPEGPASELFDLSGNQLLKAGDTRGMAGWVSPSELLIFSAATSGPSGQVGEVTVGGVNPVDGRRATLGTISVAVTECTWTDRFLICPGSTGFEVWRFA